MSVPTFRHNSASHTDVCEVEIVYEIYRHINPDIGHYAIRCFTRPHQGKEPIPEFPEGTVEMLGTPITRRMRLTLGREFPNVSKGYIHWVFGRNQDREYEDEWMTKKTARNYIFNYMNDNDWLMHFCNVELDWFIKGVRHYFKSCKWKQCREYGPPDRTAKKEMPVMPINIINAEPICDDILQKLATGSDEPDDDGFKVVRRGRTGRVSDARTNHYDSSRLQLSSSFRNRNQRVQ